ncbi:unnamed protein product [Polarella glacialis]|uniref:Uncharacterized protein n=1 Tax=Polarella glacialis TaxID=89957 RepID=A0A813IC86_POLGL|nr:unnamed protein product [Polarella glacialis]
MLTISISESLSIGPEANWSEWQAENDMVSWMDGNDASGATESTGQQPAASPWELPGLQHLNEFAIWQQQGVDPSMGKPLWPSAPIDFRSQAAGKEAKPLPEMTWQAPQKLAVEGGETMVPTSSWASPLRVPLPEPMVEGTPLADMPFDLPSELTSLARAATWSPDEKSMSVLNQAAGCFGLEPPPGLRVPSRASAAEQGLEKVAAAAAAAVLLQKPAAPALSAADHALPLGMSIGTADVGGSTCTRIEWRIEDLYGKLQASMGRPLVSPPFSALGLPNLRLMVFPDGRDTMKNARSGERKGLYAAMIKKGPLHGALKLKADCLECATVMKVNLTVGKVRAGPLRYDFSEQAIHGLDDFGVDWLKQVDKSNGSLTVGMEILEVRSQDTVR